MDDAKYVALAKAIAKKESNNNPNIYGDNNTSYGLGQWNNLGKPLAKGELPAVWKEHAGIVLGDSNAPMTELNQKAVLTGMVKKWATEDKLQPFEIAAKWNSGSAQGWENKAGTTIVNGKSLTYNTPAYVKEVDSIFKKFLSQIPQQEPIQKPAGYDVSERILSQEEKQANLLNAQQQAEAMSKKTKRAKSPLGFLANVGVGIGETLTSSQIGLGKTIGKAMSSKNLKGSTQNIDNLVQSNIQTAQKIKEFEAQGKDATNLKRAFNENLKLIEENKKAIGGYQESLPTSGQVIGQVAGTGLDILTAGQGSKATAGMKSFRPAKAGVGVIQGAGIATGLPEVSQMAGQKASGLFTKQGTKNILKGAGVGYASDVSQGLQGMRGEDRTGSSAFIPGLGTAIGGGIPTVAEAVKTGQKFIKPNAEDINLAKKNIEDVYVKNVGTSQAGKKKINAQMFATEMKNKAGTDGLAPHQILAGDGIVPKAKGNQFATLNQAENYKAKTIKLNEQGKKVLKELEYSTPKVKIADLEKDAISRAMSKENIDAGVADDLTREIRREYSKLRKNYGDEILLSQVDDIKSARWNKVNFTKFNPFESQADKLKKDADYLIAKSAQKRIEKIADDAGAADIAQFNRDMGDRFAAAKFLADMDGKSIKGSFTTKLATRIIGGSMGNSIPSRVFGMLGGDLIGEAILRQSVSPASQRIILRNLEQQDPASYAKVVKWLDEQKLAKEIRPKLPAGSKLGTEKNPIITPAPSKTPTQTTYEAPAQVIKNSTPVYERKLLPAGNKNQINSPTKLLPAKIESEQVIQQGLDEVKNAKVKNPFDRRKNINYQSLPKKTTEIKDVSANATKNSIIPKSIAPKNKNASEDLISEAKKYKSAEEFVKAQPKTVNVWRKSRFNNDGAYVDYPIIRKENNITLYQGGDKGQHWTPDRKYAEQFGNVKEKTGSFYQIDNGNRMTDVYVEAPTKSQLTDIWNKANKKNNLKSKTLPKKSK